MDMTLYQKMDMTLYQKMDMTLYQEMDMTLYWNIDMILYWETDMTLCREIDMALYWDMSMSLNREPLLYSLSCVNYCTLTYNCQLILTAGRFPHYLRINFKPRRKSRSMVAKTDKQSMDLWRTMNVQEPVSALPAQPIITSDP